MKVSNRFGFVEPLPRSFFQRETADVARALLGQRIIATTSNGPLAVRIVETEAYEGPEDPASHARFGPSSQAHRMWEAPGTAYVYICYGIHQMLNVVAHPRGDARAGAVLFRAAEPKKGIEAMRERRGNGDEMRLANGPGNLTEALGIVRARHDGVDLTDPSGLFLARGEPVADPRVAATGRIGISQGQDRALRFVDNASSALSRRVSETVEKEA